MHFSVPSPGSCNLIPVEGGTSVGLVCANGVVEREEGGGRGVGEAPIWEKSNRARKEESSRRTKSSADWRS
ncbi:hypothetical protein CDAR_65901 [Caerostris darwini]|uniref:Uncharacterized protein n=1 Tax=Caerostris darwini TaxID=1538125 RepID=A0AAV4UC33_9ARAC|nr:hypothetical protein CDAR_65901 [Caerostris darwini]